MDFNHKPIFSIPSDLLNFQNKEWFAGLISSHESKQYLTDYSRLLFWWEENIRIANLFSSKISQMKSLSKGEWFERLITFVLPKDSSITAQEEIFFFFPLPKNQAFEVDRSRYFPTHVSQHKQARTDMEEYAS